MKALRGAGAAAVCAVVGLALGAVAEVSPRAGPGDDSWTRALAANADEIAKSPEEAKAAEAAERIGLLSVPHRLEWSRRLLSLMPKSRSLRLALADALLRGGDAAQGRVIAEDVVRENGGDSAFLRDAAVTFEAWRQWDLAAGVFRNLLEEIPEDVWARLHLARDYQMSGDRRRALDEYLRIVARGLHPDLRLVLEAYREARVLGAEKELKAEEEIWGSQIRGGAPNAKPYVLSAQSALWKKDGPSLIGLCGAVRARFPEEPACSQLLASYYEERGDWDDLIALRRLSLQRPHPRWEDFVTLVRACVAAGRWADAQQALREAKKALPDMGRMINSKIEYLARMSGGAFAPHEPAPTVDVGFSGGVWKASSRGWILSASPDGREVGLERRESVERIPSSLEPATAAVLLEGLLEHFEKKRFSAVQETSPLDAELTKKLRDAGYLGP
ncbi:MAG: tetratricopeptide repeat protein [Elusimicrobiota bacterium]